MKLHRFARYTWFVLLYTVAVILWGAYVRASRSGAGCGSHWPLCNGEVIPRAHSVETVIEVTHRLTSGLTLPLMIGLVVWAFRAFPRKHPARTSAVLSLIFILTEALIGAGLVHFELVADNASIARAMVMSAHLINTFLLVGSLALTAWWGRDAAARMSFKAFGQSSPWGWLCVVALVLGLVLGMSGAVAALGDTLFPANSLAEGLRQDWSPTAHLLIRLRLLHPTIAVVFTAYATILAALLIFLPSGEGSKRFALALIFSLLAQFGLGLLNVVLLAPVWLQLVHLLFANLVWVALVLLTANVLAERETAAAGVVEEIKFNAELKAVGGGR